ncbi:MAG: endonuclease [Flavobacteriaceae bacterium]|nr:MAG: endonuclease [Flavobacteriaceae bacterium]
MNLIKIKSQRILLIMITLAFIFYIPKLHPQQTYSSKEISIISWNIQDFGKSKSDSIINAIANIVRDYDIVALQEVVAGYGGSQAVAKLANSLNRTGSKWDYAISSPTQSPPYKTEKYAYLWKTSNLTLLKKPRLLSELNPVVFREPYLIRFKLDHKIITLLNYHARKHNDKPEEEISQIIEYLKTNNQTILLGDFNLSETHTIWNSLYKLHYKASLKNNPTTLKRKCNGGKYTHHAIDNMYYNTKNIVITRTGKVDFVANCDLLKKARKISDHLPIFIHFRFK